MENIETIEALQYIVDLLKMNNSLLLILIGFEVMRFAKGIVASALGKRERR